MYENADGRVVVLHERHPVARKEHKCNECRRGINRGESYMVERYVFDGEQKTHKTCAHCQVVRNWIAAECGGWVYSGLREDIQEHVQEGYYGFAVKKLAIGVGRKWTRKDGRPWPIPAMPPVTAQHATLSYQ